PIVGSRRAVDDDDGVGLGDVDAAATAGILVVAPPSEEPGDVIVAGVGHAGAESELTVEVHAADAGGRAGQGVCLSIVGPSIGRDVDAGVGLGDVDRAAA